MWLEIILTFNYNHIALHLWSDFFSLKTPLSIKIYSSTAQLPENWKNLTNNNIFLSPKYLEILEKSGPENMTSHFVGVYKENELVGIALSQFLDLNKLDSFGERDRCLKTMVRNLVFKNFCSHVLLIGNNMLTGQNAYIFSDKINIIDGLKTLRIATEELKTIYNKKGKKVHVVSFKDFPNEAIPNFHQAGFKDSYQFSTQPNMVFDILNQWKTEQHYIEALSKKYRDQFKRARKKAEGIEKRKMHLDDIIKYEETIYNLYYHVAKNAHFNTFFLAKNHFRTFKELLHDKFLFYGYFLEGKLIGFNTLIKNGEVMDTYFLGYDESIQREKMLYLNMLYDMISYSINKGFKKIIFARTALEIKSSVGAKPQEMFGFIQHENSIIDLAIDKVFRYLDPEVFWNERNPFK